MSVQEPNDGWKPCPEGAISNLVNRTKIESRRAALQRGAIGACAVVLTGFSGAYIASKSGMFKPEAPAMLACSEVLQYLPEYIDGNLAASIREQIEHHLDICPHCEEHHQALASNQIGP